MALNIPMPPNPMVEQPASERTLPLSLSNSSSTSRQLASQRSTEESPPDAPGEAGPAARGAGSAQDGGGCQ